MVLMCFLAGTKSIVPTMMATATVSAAPAEPTQDPGLYYIEPLGTNVTTTTTSTTRTYVLFYATYRPTTVAKDPGAVEPFMSSDRITLITLVTILICAVGV
jgi:hypothetical protein